MYIRVCLGETTLVVHIHDRTGHEISPILGSPSLLNIASLLARVCLQPQSLEFLSCRNEQILQPVDNVESTPKPHANGTARPPSFVEPTSFTPRNYWVCLRLIWPATSTRFPCHRTASPHFFTSSLCMFRLNLRIEQSNVSTEFEVERQS